MLFLAHEATPSMLADAAAQFARHGMPTPAPLDLGRWQGLHAGYAANTLPTFHAKGDDFVAIAGTLVYDGALGTAALAGLLRDFRPPAPDWSRTGGQFVALIRRQGRMFLFTDWFGAFPLYHDEQRRSFSTSFLTMLGALPRVAWDRQGVWEYAFAIAPIGDTTVIAGVSTLGPGEVIELIPDGSRRHSVAKPLPDRTRAMPLPERIERHHAALCAIVAPHAAAFGDRIHCPLSGGIDARLLLASLRAAGSDPQVYVYGGADTADVRIARGIGAAQGFPVAWHDKRAGLPDPDAFPAMVADEFHLLDGLPNYGNIFDNGGNAAAMAARHGGDALAASGGCGEIYRDFFYLPDRPASPRTVARAFFAQFAAADAVGFDRHAFLTGMAEKIGAALGAGADDRLPRAVIEQAYPRVRCRALFGREIGIEARLGPYLMPFLDHRVAAEGIRIPMALKQAGRLEAALLTHIDPALAAEPSAYGHSFAEPPSLGRRRSEWASRHRPVWLRERSYALRRRMGRVGDDHGGLTGPDYLPRVVDTTYPAMHRFFAVDGIRDAGLMRRVAALEYLAGWLGGRLAG